MIFLSAFLTYHFFPLFCLSYCNISHYYNKRCKRPFRCWRLSNWIDQDNRSSSRYWALVAITMCERREQEHNQEGGFVRSVIYCWLAASQCYMVPTNRTQFRGIKFFLNLNSSKHSGPSACSLDLPKRQNPSSPAVQACNPDTRNASNFAQASEKELTVDLLPDYHTCCITRAQ